ncbi:hypothetical protein HKBW3S25_02078, partial [Candidatus Hakubella thermalkaliphila]
HPAFFFKAGWLGTLTTHRVPENQGLELDLDLDLELVELWHVQNFAHVRGLFRGEFHDRAKFVGTSVRADLPSWYAVLAVPAQPVILARVHADRNAIKFRSPQRILVAARKFGIEALAGRNDLLPAQRRAAVPVLGCAVGVVALPTARVFAPNNRRAALLAAAHSAL